MEELLGKNIIVFDLEIRNSIDGKEITWKDYLKMGISCGCAFDYRDGDYKVYLKDNVGSLVSRLNENPLIVAFNQLGFDLPLLRAHFEWLKDNDALNNFDMLNEGRKAIGWSPGDTYPKGCKLDNFLEETFGKQFMKTEDASLVPNIWKEGQYGRVITYCLSDVRREKMLFEFIYMNGYAKTSMHGIHKFINPRVFMDGV